MLIIIDVWTKLIRMSAQQAMSISTRTGIQRQEIIAEHHEEIRVSILQDTVGEIRSSWS
jgi:hypothetical protein